MGCPVAPGGLLAHLTDCASPRGSPGRARTAAPSLGEMTTQSNATYSSGVPIGKWARRTSFVTWAPLRRGFFAAGTAFQWRPRPRRITGAYPRTLRSASAGAGRSQKVILRSRIGTRALPAKDGDLRTRAPAPRAARAPRTRWGARGSARDRCPNKWPRPAGVPCLQLTL